MYFYFFFFLKFSCFSHFFFFLFLFELLYSSPSLFLSPLLFLLRPLLFILVTFLLHFTFVFYLNCFSVIFVLFLMIFFWWATLFLLFVSTALSKCKNIDKKAREEKMLMAMLRWLNNMDCQAENMARTIHMFACQKEH